MDISTVASGLRAACQTITGLDVYETPPARVNPPAAIVSVGPGKYHQAFGSASTAAIFNVTLLLSLSEPRVAYAQLANFASPTHASSIRAAVESASISGVSQRMDGWSEPFAEEIGGQHLLGVTFDVEVID